MQRHNKNCEGLQLLFYGCSYSHINLLNGDARSGDYIDIQKEREWTFDPLAQQFLQTKDFEPKRLIPEPKFCCSLYVFMNTKCPATVVVTFPLNCIKAEKVEYRIKWIGKMVYSDVKTTMKTGGSHTVTFVVVTLNHPECFVIMINSVRGKNQSLYSRPLLQWVRENMTYAASILFRV